MKEYTKEQMELWGYVNVFAGCAAITVTHFIFLLSGSPPLDWVWQGVLLIVLVSMGFLYYRKYQKTKVNENEREDMS